MITPTQATRLRRLIKRFAKATHEKAWIRAQEPESKNEIMVEYRMSKHALDTYIIHLARVTV